MIKSVALAEDMESVYAVCPPYVSPGSTNWYDIINGSGCDCSGLPCAIYRRHGMSLYHGSNTIARLYLTSREKLTSASQLVVGMAVFKWSASGGEPEKYRADGLGDFHHIGIVTSVKPLRIIHQSSASGCTACDTTIKKWAYCGTLKGIDYKAAPDPAPQPEGDSMYKIKINTDKLRIRREPNTYSDVLGSLTRGQIVDASAMDGSWFKLADRDGYVSAMYCVILEQKADSPAEAPVTPGDDQEHVPSIEERLTALEERVRILEES